MYATYRYIYVVICLASCSHYASSDESLWHLLCQAVENPTPYEIRDVLAQAGCEIGVEVSLFCFYFVFLFLLIYGH